jgi:type IV pilus assembly protein PilP
MSPRSIAKLTPLRTSVALLLGLVLVAAAGCSDDPKPPPAAASGAAAKPKAPARGAKGAGATGPAAPSNLPPLPTREFHPRDFDESELSRDPFRTFEEMFRSQAQRKVVVQREVLASKFSLDQLKIVGIVTGQAGRIMMNDPGGFGWVIKVGDFVGRPEVVRTGGATGTEVAVNWRLDRIRPNDAVFLREDPTRPDVPATTRVVSLRTEAELNPEIRTGVRQTATAQPLGEGNAPPAPRLLPPPPDAAGAQQAPPPPPAPPAPQQPPPAPPPR